MIFQDALSSLNPVFSVGWQLGELARVHQGASRAQGKARAVELLEMVGIPAAKARVNDFPHQFSGGMRQRVMIAMALALQPDVIIADEPTTALDVTVQAQVMGLLSDLQKEMRLGLILITHDMGVVADVTDKICVMYAGRRGRAGRRLLDLRAARAPVHQGASRVDPAGRPEGPGAHGDQGPPAGPHRPAQGLRLPPALHLRPGPVQDRGATALRAARQPHQRLSLRRGGARVISSQATEPELTSGEHSDDVVLDVRNVRKYFPLTRGIVFRRTVGHVKAVDGVSVQLRRGETLGVVGESGCGKSTFGRLLMGLEKPTEGSIKILGEEMAGLSQPRDAPDAAQHPDRAAGPLLLARPPDDGRRHRRRAVRDPHRRARQGQASAERAGAARGRRPQPRPHQPLPPPVLRWPAPADRDRPGARPAAEDHRLRRAGVGARRVGAGAGHQPASRTCRPSSGCPTSSSPTTSPWSGTSRTGWW